MFKNPRQSLLQILAVWFCFAFRSPSWSPDPETAPGAIWWTWSSTCWSDPWRPQDRCLNGRQELSSGMVSEKLWKWKKYISHKTTQNDHNIYPFSNNNYRNIKVDIILIFKGVFLKYTNFWCFGVPRKLHNSLKLVYFLFISLATKKEKLNYFKKLS